MSQSLPTPGGDVGTWGTMLNGFLNVSHNSDGTLSTSAVSTAGAEMTSNKNQASGYAGLNGSTLVSTTLLGTGTGSSSNFLRGDGTWAVPPTASNATTGATGLVQLAGDLGGSGTTATAPTLAATSNVESIISANTTVAGALQASGNLSAVADAGTSRFNLSTPILSAVAAVSTTNISTSAPGASIDGYSFQTNDEVLLTGQSTPSQNGVWIWNSASSALTRPNEFPTGGVVKRGRVVAVINGTNYADTVWILNSVAAGITIDTTSQTWINPLSTNYAETIIRANSLNQLATATGNYSMGGFRTTNQGQGIVATDAAQLGQLAGNQFPYVVSGCVWTADAAGSTRNASMTAGTVMVKGILLTAAAVTSRSFTASDDTYIDLSDNGDGTAKISYTAVANNTTVPALASSGTPLNTIRVAIIAAGSSSIASSGVFQGAIAAFGGTTNPNNSQFAGTVAAGSNGQAIGSLTGNALDYATTSGTAPTGGGYASVVTSTTTALISFTSATSTVLSGVSLICGSGNVATSNAITGIAPWGAISTVNNGFELATTDMAGNLIFPTSPYPKVIGYAQFAGIVTSTQSGAVNLFQLTAPFIIPSGMPSRYVKVSVRISFFGSSSAATTQGVIKLGSGATVGVYSDVQQTANDASGMEISGIQQVAAGSNNGQFTFSTSAGTLSAGAALSFSAISVELL